MSADTPHNLSPDMRAAIGVFLYDSQRGDQSFDVAEALDAVRRVFPNLEISDGELVDAITSEASAAGFDIHYDTDQSPKALERRALERWDDEGGATGRPWRRELSIFLSIGACTRFSPVQCAGELLTSTSNHVHAVSGSLALPWLL